MVFVPYCVNLQNAMIKIAHFVLSTFPCADLACTLAPDLPFLCTPEHTLHTQHRHCLPRLPHHQSIQLKKYPKTHPSCCTQTR